MPRGGLRPAANGSLEHLIKPKWRSGPTQTIRVPQALAKQLLDYAHRLDDGEAVVVLQGNTEDLISRSNLAKILLERCEYLEQLGRGTEVQEQAIALLHNAITLRAKGGSYAANNATGLKRLVEQALELLEGQIHE